MHHGTNASRFAGAWYPADPDRLATLLNSSAPLRSEPDSARPPRVAVLPHAGLAYSARGQAAFWQRRASCCRDGRGRPDAIVILAPSHHVPLRRDTTLGAAFSGHETTGGTVPGLPVNLGDRTDPSVVAEEHAVELLLPALKHFGITVPVAALLAAPLSGPPAARAIADRVLDRLTAATSLRNDAGVDPDRVLWLVSSDFTHYGPRFGFCPFGNRRYGEIRDAVAEEDLRVAEAAASGSLERFWASIQGESTVCGRYAIALALALLERVGAAPAAGRVLSYYTSADGTPTPEEERDFVCYATVEVCTE